MAQNNWRPLTTRVPIPEPNAWQIGVNMDVNAQNDQDAQEAEGWKRGCEAIWEAIGLPPDQLRPVPPTVEINEQANGAGGEPQQPFQHHQG